MKLDIQVLLNRTRSFRDVMGPLHLSKQATGPNSIRTPIARERKNIELSHQSEPFRLYERMPILYKGANMRPFAVLDKE
jgi:hypothetical protein